MCEIPQLGRNIYIYRNHILLSHHTILWNCCMQFGVAKTRRALKVTWWLIARDRCHVPLAQSISKERLLILVRALLRVRSWSIKTQIRRKINGFAFDPSHEHRINFGSDALPSALSWNHVKFDSIRHWRLCSTSSDESTLCRGKVSVIEARAGRELTIRNPTALLRVPPEIWGRILSREHLRTFLDASDLVIIQTICWDAAIIIQPYIYRHVNLLDFNAFTSFSEAIEKCQLNPGQWVRTLQISFDTEGLPKSFFKSLSKTLSALERLHCLLFCYSHHERTFVFNLRNLATSFPPSLKELHLKPILEECWRNCPGIVCLSHYAIYSLADWYTGQ